MKTCWCARPQVRGLHVPMAWLACACGSHLQYACQGGGRWSAEPLHPSAHKLHGTLTFKLRAGAGKTNIAMLSVLREVGQNMRHGVIQKADFKIVYVAPMKVGADLSGPRHWATCSCVHRPAVTLQAACAVRPAKLGANHALLGSPWAKRRRQCTMLLPCLHQPCLHWFQPLGLCPPRCRPWLLRWWSTFQRG